MTLLRAQARASVPAAPQSRWHLRGGRPGRRLRARANGPATATVLAQRLELLARAVDIANESRGIEDAVADTLRLLCRHSGWVLGRAVVAVREHPQTFVDSGVWWMAPGCDHHAFIARVDGLAQGRGADPLGSVLASGEPRWVADLARVRAAPWVEAARAAGLRSTLGVPIRAGRLVLGALQLFSPHTTMPDLEESALMSRVGGELGRTIERERFMRRLTDLADEESRRLAQELHDGIGQTLAGVRLITASMLQDQRAGRPPDGRRVASLARGVDYARAQVRALTRGMLPMRLRARELPRALEELADRFSRMPGIECRFRRPSAPLAMDDITATQLHGIAQEAVRNAVEHGRAHHVTVRLDGRDRIVLSVRDDGIGLDPVARLPGSGLRIMRYRADLIAGTLTVESPVGGGVLVTCSVPPRAPGFGAVAEPAAPRRRRAPPRRP